jgi:hypothetical protein
MPALVSPDADRHETQAAGCRAVELAIEDSLLTHLNV